MEIAFPIEFLVRGTPVSLSSQNANAREQWKNRIKDASSRALPSPHFASVARLAVTISGGAYAGRRRQYCETNTRRYVPPCICGRSTSRAYCFQKFEPGSIFSFSKPAPLM